MGRSCCSAQLGRAVLSFFSYAAAVQRLRGQGQRWVQEWGAFLLGWAGFHLWGSHPTELGSTFSHCWSEAGQMRLVDKGDCWGAGWKMLLPLLVKQAAREAWRWVGLLGGGKGSSGALHKAKHQSKNNLPRVPESLAAALLTCTTFSSHFLDSHFLTYMFFYFSSS